MSRGIPLEEALDILETDMAKCDLVVSHNLEFDRNVLGAEFLRGAGFNVLPQMLGYCTMVSTTNFCAIPSPRGYKYPKLEELYFKLFKVKLLGAHDAMVDVEALFKCFKELQRMGIVKIARSNNELLQISAKDLVKQFDDLRSGFPDKLKSNPKGVHLVILDFFRKSESILIDLKQTSGVDSEEYKHCSYLLMHTITQGIVAVYNGGKSAMNNVLSSDTYGKNLAEFFIYILSELRKIETDGAHDEYVTSILNVIKDYHRKNETSNESQCYIATMAYGDPMHPQVILLRKFRDNKLKSNQLGKAFIDLYYLTSPSIVKYFGRYKPFVNFSKKILDFLIYKVIR
ncbi:3'-5' exonuclease [Dyadobacter bucti]|uniref:3'-5' exonuclease n=1 Tax=Dyadobacter bucti TaxID=2572203 RepID=UPI001108A655|nr:3'-5' exonuclease [Dyadobacter bucti]